MFKKIAALTLALLLCAGLMAGCGNSGATSSDTATADNPLVLTLAHGLSEVHTVHIAMTQFAQEVSEKTNGRIQVKIFPNGQLGSENENLEQLQAGVIAMTKVSAPGLATYNEAYNAFGLPYIFNDTEDFYNVMDSQQMQDFFLSTGEDGFVTLTYFTSGARSFYTKDTAIRTPEDLKGLKIRVQDMKSQTDMMAYLGGTPVAMSYGDVYTSLQTGIIDGTENNETALTTGKHGEVCKVYSVDQHAMIPDVMIMSQKVWEQISPEDQQIILEAAHNATEAHKVMWDAAIEEAVKEAQESMGVEFVYDVDKEAFRKATQPMIEAYEAQYPGVAKLLDTIEEARGEE
ncbi:MAG: TRAP transporter substrate-binding protein [Faecousia sp.]